MKKILIVVGLILIISIFITVIAIFYFSGTGVFNGSMQMVTNETTSIESGKRYLESVHFDLEKFKSEYSMETIQINSSLDNHVIPADYIMIDGNKDRDTVIMVHGLGGNRLSVYPIAEIFLRNGYNVIAYDQRSSGENTAQYTTYGYFESNDVTDYVNYLKENIGDNNKIGLWGTSFGGATVGIYLGSESANDNIDFAILDCPVSNMSYLISTEMKKMDIGLPLKFLMWSGDITTKFKLGFSYEDTNVCNYTNNTTVPTLIINSKSDEITPYFMGEDIYNSIKHDNKKIFTVEDSKHVDIVFDYPDEYKKEIIEFIK